MAERRNILFLILFGGALFVTTFLFAAYILMVFYFDSDFAVGDAVAVVDIHGEIRYDLNKIREIESYRENNRVKAVLLHINSPGGGVAASQELYHAVQRLSERKPVVAFFAEVGASGAYYIACAADSIISLEGTLTGSIGVIAAFLRTEELFHKIGLDVTVIKSGKYKDIGSPHREITEEERDYLEELLKSAYTQFLKAVMDGRGMTLEEVEQVAEGRLYSGEMAKSHNLVDKIGTYDDAIITAAMMGGIDGKPKIIRKRKKKRFFESLFSRMAAPVPFGAESRVALKYIIP